MLLWVKHREQERDYERQLAKIVLETGNTLPTSTNAKLPGDPRALRGIPALAQGVGGSMAGTRPEIAIERLDRQADP